MTISDDPQGDRQYDADPSQHYHDALATIKIQIDIIVRNHNAVHAWLNEVQRCLNRARLSARETKYNEDQDNYDL